VAPFLVLVLVTAAFGWSFVPVKEAVVQYPVAPFIALRFAVAVLVLMVIARRLPERRAIRIGLIIGASVAAGYALQTYGLQRTAPGTAGLITGLYVVFTPIIDRAFGARIARRTWVAVTGALAGTALLAGAAGGGAATVSIADLLVLASALCWAVQIVLLARRGPGLRPVDLALLQLGATSAAFAAVSTASGSWRPPNGEVWFAVVATAVLASSFAFPLQAWAQTRMSAARAALILAMEPAWALLFSMILTGQRLGPVQVIGAVLVLAAVIGHEAVPLLAVARSVGRRAGARVETARARGRR
jgi:drug/metabolite transporter (DMT)-like permease